MGAIVSLVAVLAAAAVAAFAATLFWALVARPWLRLRYERNHHQRKHRRRPGATAAQRDTPREVGSARTAG